MRSKLSVLMMSVFFYSQVLSAQEEVFQYSVKNYPVSAEQCPTTASQIAERFERASGKVVVGSSCEPSFSKGYRNIVVSYFSSQQLFPISTISEFGGDQGTYASFESCQTQLSERVTQFETHTALSAVVSYCYPESSLSEYSRPFALRIESFGTPAKPPFFLLDNVYTRPRGDLDSILAEIKESLSALGALSPTVSIHDQSYTFRMVVQYYAENELPVRFSQLFKFSNVDECREQISKVEESFQNAGSRVLSVFCTEPKFTDASELYALVHVQSGYKISKFNSLYETFAACQTDADRVSQMYRERLGIDVVGAVCSYEETVTLQKQGFFLHLFSRL